MKLLFILWSFTAGGMCWCACLLKLLHVNELQITYTLMPSLNLLSRVGTTFRIIILTASIVKENTVPISSFWIAFWISSDLAHRIMSCFAILRQLRSNRRSILSSMLLSDIDFVYHTDIKALPASVNFRCLVLSIREYITGLFTYVSHLGASVCHECCCQVLHGFRCSDHITLTLPNLHWLKVS